MAIVTRSEVKVFLGITDTSKDDLIDALIPQVEDDYLLIRNREFDDDSSDLTVYPGGAELVAAQMIAFHMASFMKSGAGLQSESIGSYSYSRASNADTLYGYPKSVVSRIKRYVSVK